MKFIRTAKAETESLSERIAKKKAELASLEPKVESLRRIVAAADQKRIAAQSEIEFSQGLESIGRAADVERIRRAHEDATRDYADLSAKLRELESRRSELVENIARLEAEQIQAEADSYRSAYKEAARAAIEAVEAARTANVRLYNACREAWERFPQTETLAGVKIHAGAGVPVGLHWHEMLPGQDGSFTRVDLWKLGFARYDVALLPESDPSRIAVERER